MQDERSDCIVHYFMLSTLALVSIDAFILFFIICRVKTKLYTLNTPAFILNAQVSIVENILYFEERLC